MDDDVNERLDTGSGILLEKVDNFCYAGDMLDADRATVRC